MSDVDKQLKNTNKEINSHILRYRRQHPDHHVFWGSVAVFSFIFLISALVFLLGPQITGFVTFTQSATSYVDTDITVVDSGTVELSNPLSGATALLISGKVIGSGSASVFLIEEGKRYLVYHFEGDAGEGIEFKDSCYGTCYVNELSKNPLLYIDLDGVVMELSGVNYIYDKLIEFNLEPKSIQLDFKKNPTSIIDITLTNDQLVDYSVLIYVEGPLAQYFTLPVSVVDMSSNVQEQTIHLNLKLPSNLEKGSYTNTVVARYIPQNGAFAGATPVEESYVTVINN